MQWFKASELDKLITLIDDEKIAPIGKWFWEDFKNNTGTVVMGYLYAVEHGSPTKIRKKLRDLIHPAGKPSALVFKDVISEIYHENGISDFIKLVNALVEDEVVFEIKDGDVAYEILENPKLKKAQDAYKAGNLNFISAYMKAEEKGKLSSILFKSDNYESVKQAMSDSKFSAANSKVRAYAKAAQRDFAREAHKIVNIKLRRRYLLEFVFTKNSRTNEDLYETLTEHYKKGALTADDLVNILSEMGSAANGNGRPNILMDALVKDDKIDELKEIIKNHNGGYDNKPFMLDYAIAQASSMMTELGANFIFSLSDIIDTDMHKEALLDIFKTHTEDNFRNKFAKTYPKLLKDNPDLVIQAFGGFDIVFQTEFITANPDALDKISPDDLPEDIKDFFIF